jgi:hypothetical protein
VIYDATKMAIIPTAKANRSGSAIAIPYSFPFYTLRLLTKQLVASSFPFIR